MTESNKIRFLIFVSLMIFPAHTLDVILSSADGYIKQTFEIKTNTINGEKNYNGTSNQFTYQIQPNTSKVIVHISSQSRFVEIMRHAVHGIRLQISQELREKHCEIVFLGIENFDDDEYILISSFMVNKIRGHQSAGQKICIETIGENRFDRFYKWHVRNFPKYQENAQICEGNLIARLRSISRGALRPVGSNNKKIKSYEYQPEQSFLEEVTWPIHVEDNKYVPAVDISVPEYNFKMRHPNDTIYLVILSGKEYSQATNIGRYSVQMKEIVGILEEMTKNNEVLIILGVYNFDWTEIDILTQFILKHSEGGPASDYNVFTCGCGMFNTMYKDFSEEDRRHLLQQPNSYVAEVMKILQVEEVKQRSIVMYQYVNYEWRLSKIPINLSNGRYFSESFNSSYFPWLNEKYAFIVYESTELNDAIDISTVCETAEKLKRSGIHVALIEAINFGLDDMHIIAEWIDYHKGNISSEQIAVLGCGIFDTFFQSEITTYDQFPNKKKWLQRIRNAHVKRANGKFVYAAKIDDANLEFRSYPVNTVNGFYEPDLIADWNMFDTRDGKMLYFIIISTDIFRQILAAKNVGKAAWMLREKLRKNDPYLEWSVFLVNLHNFCERDSHLFAELVKTHTMDERSLEEFVRTFDFGIRQTIYQYKDTPPFSIEDRPRMHKNIKNFFENACGLPPGYQFQ